MSLLLLPRLGVANPISFANNFTVSKDSPPWSDGGGDTFDNTTGVQTQTISGGVPTWFMLGDTSYTTADGVISASTALGINGVQLGVYSGWCVPGIWACEVELGTQPNSQFDLRFMCNPGYDNATPTGIVTKSFMLGANSYELKTIWTTFGQQDSWNTTGETQFTITIVPYLASQNLTGVNPFTWSVPVGGAFDDRDYRLSNVIRGATMYIQWGKVNVDAVQNWIIGDLLESEEFTSTPHARTSLSSILPCTRGVTNVMGKIDCSIPDMNLKGNASYSTTSVSHTLPMTQNASKAILGLTGRINCPIPDMTIKVNASYSTTSVSHTLLMAQNASKDITRTTGKRDVYFGGAGQIQGTVKNTPGIPVSRRVVLIDEASRLPIAETFSDAITGAYQFNRINPSLKYTVLSYDHTGSYRATTIDGLNPVITS